MLEDEVGGLKEELNGKRERIRALEELADAEFSRREEAEKSAEATKRQLTSATADVHKLREALDAESEAARRAVEERLVAESDAAVTRGKLDALQREGDRLTRILDEERTARLADADAVAKVCRRLPSGAETGAADDAPTRGRSADGSGSAMKASCNAISRFLDRHDELVVGLEALQEAIRSSRRGAERLGTALRNEVGDEVLHPTREPEPSADGFVKDWVRGVAGMRVETVKCGLEIESSEVCLHKLLSSVNALRSRLATLNESRKNMAGEIVSVKDDNSRLSERIETDLRYLQHTRWALLMNTVYTRDAVFAAMRELNVLCSTVRQAKSQWPALYDSVARSLNPVIDAVKLVQSRNLQILNQCASDEERAAHRELVGGATGSFPRGISTAPPSTSQEYPLRPSHSPSRSSDPFSPDPHLRRRH